MPTLAVGNHAKEIDAKVWSVSLKSLMNGLIESSQHLEYLVAVHYLSLPLMAVQWWILLVEVLKIKKVE